MKVIRWRGVLQKVSALSYGVASEERRLVSRERGWEGGETPHQSACGFQSKIKQRWDQTPQQQKGRLEQSGELTEFITVFCADCRDDSISEHGDLVCFALVDELCNTGPALALTGGLGGVLREAL